MGRSRADAAERGVAAANHDAAEAAEYATGMIAGAIGLVFYSVAAAFLVEHLNAVMGSALAWAAWLVPAAIVYAVFLR